MGKKRNRMTRNTTSRQLSVHVSANAVIKRINRCLAEKDMRLVVLRGKNAEEYGRFVVIDKPNLADIAGWGKHGPLHSRLEQENVDLETLGRELGVLKSGESVAREWGPRA
jgi:hypothetical protein